MTAVGLLLPKNPVVRFTGGIAKEKVKPLLVVSADSHDSVERIRQIPSGESAAEGRRLNRREEMETPFGSGMRLNDLPPLPAAAKNP